LSVIKRARQLFCGDHGTIIIILTVDLDSASVVSSPFRYLCY